MSKIAYILLCHDDPAAIIEQAKRLTSVDDYISIHFDARSDTAHFSQISNALKDNPNVTFARKRIKCGWGEWSLVQATLYAVEAALEAFPRATHFYLLSGDCMAIKTAEYVHQFLDDNDAEFIECFDFFDSDWIKTGLKDERLIYRHFFNERTAKGLFEASLNLQRSFGLTRQIPQDIQVQIGSQWWCLRRQTIESVIDFIRVRPDVIRFFRTTWIPDETFFQTIVTHLIPGVEIRSRTLTFLMFTDYGRPVMFYNDHYDLLVGQDYLFSRKISPEANELQRRLGLLYNSENVPAQISNEGRHLFHFLTSRGRVGRRFATRFWEAESTLGRDCELMIIICKKWHVGKRLLERIRHMTNVPCIEYLFDEEHAPMPDLGGIQTTLTKRTRHRRALMRMLLDYYETDQLIICIDPSAIELLQDFATDRSVTRMLEIQCEFSREYLIGHAMRMGLASEQTSESALENLLLTMANDMIFQSDRIRDAGFENLNHMRLADDLNEHALALAGFLGVPLDKARAIAQVNNLIGD